MVQKIDRYKLLGAINFAIMLGLSFIAARYFLQLHKEELIVPGPGVSQVKKLSEYFPKLTGTRGDTELYFLEGKEPGGTVFIIGGTHSDEYTGFFAALIALENMVVEKGRVIIAPRMNKSASTHTTPGEAYPQGAHFVLPDGSIRWFKNGSRFTNPIDQWPDPTIYRHEPSGQQLAWLEKRNLNRAYPGNPDGELTLKLAHAIGELIRKEKIDVTIDLHEAAPEYPVIDALVAHEKIEDVAGMVVLDMQMEGIRIKFEPSPKNFHGLSHRELGDFTDTNPILMETIGALQGRIRGKTTEDLLLTGKDRMYVRAAKMGRLFVPYDEKGHPVKERAGRHLSGIRYMIEEFSNFYPKRAVVFRDLPTYPDMMEKGVEAFLNPIPPDTDPDDYFHKPLKGSLKS